MGDLAVSRRKGELSAAAIDRGWPHQVAVPADDCRGSRGRFMDAFCLDLSVCERHHSVFHEDKWWTIYCLANPEHAEKFRLRFRRRAIQSQGAGPWLELGTLVQEPTLSAKVRCASPPIASAVFLAIVA